MGGAVREKENVAKSLVARVERDGGGGGIDDSVCRAHTDIIRRRGGGVSVQYHLCFAWKYFTTV